jgi:cytochrome P450
LLTFPSLSGALARTLHLLAQHPDVQEKLRAEVQEAHQGFGKDLDYDQLNSLTYLDAVCRESLRLHAPVSMIERVAQRDWVLPLQYPVKASDGKTIITHIPVKKGTYMLVSITAANRDKSVPSPLKTRPLLETNSNNVGKLGARMLIVSSPRDGLKPYPKALGTPKCPAFTHLCTSL